jgi:polysaccharide export outer membrane protein
LKLALLIAFFFILSIPGTSHCQTLDQNPGYRLGSEDVVAISIMADGEEQVAKDLAVSANGDINVPLVGKIKAAGLTLEELEKAIIKPLEKDFFVAPQIHLQIKKYNSPQFFIYIEGKIENPGVYDYQPGLTALSACIMAGGFAKFAAPNRARIIRQTEDGPKTIKLNLNKVISGELADLPLKLGDRIHIPESWL